jgi:hypothetical protein
LIDRRKSILKFRYVAIGFPIIKIELEGWRSL